MSRPTPDIESPAKPWQGELSHSRGPSDDWGTIRDERQNAIIRVPITLDEEKLVEHRRAGTDPAQQIVDEILNRINSYEETKRERDEAREELKHITEYGTEEINAAVELRQKLATALVERDEVLEECLEKAIRERDEARGKCASWVREFCKLRVLCRVLDEDACDRLRERDKARERVKELIYISERAIALAEIDFENDKFGVVSELRDGLEKIKEETK